MHCGTPIFGNVTAPEGFHVTGKYMDRTMQHTYSRHAAWDPHKGGMHRLEEPRLLALRGSGQLLAQEAKPAKVLWCFVLNPHQPHARLKTRRRRERNTNELCSRTH